MNNYQSANNRINQLMNVKQTNKRNTMKTNLSLNAQTFLDNFKQRINNTGNNTGTILTTVDNDNYKAYKELKKAGLLKEVHYFRGFSDYQLIN